MALEVGSRLGHYDVTALIGEGGMGQVYRATDTQLGRDVALKILPDAFAADPDRLARFQREAQVLASLNHPGIAAIYGIEKSDDTQALVLELVEGPTLADRIAKGPIPLSPVLRAGHALVDVLRCVWPTPGRDVPPQFRQLVLGLLVECRDPRVEGRTNGGGHHRPPSDVPALRI